MRYSESGEDNSRALAYALLLLRYRGRSRQELKTRLENKQFSREGIRYALAYLHERGYINDSEFSRQRAAWYAAKGWGSRRIEYALRAAGVDAQDREHALPSEGEEVQTLRKIIERKWRTIQGAKNDVARLVRFAASRGFTYGQIKKVLEELSISTQNNAQ